MAELRMLYAQLGFQQVTSYVQSGNVLFTTAPAETSMLATSIQESIGHQFGYEVPVMVLTLAQLVTIVSNNPLAHDPAKDPAFLHATYLATPPTKVPTALFEARQQPGEAIVVTPEAAYLYCPKGYGRTKLTNTFLEAQLGVTATTRNWKTTRKLLALARELNA